MSIVVNQPQPAETSPAESPDAPGRPEQLPTKLQIKDLSIFYGAFRAVRDVNLDVPANRILAIIGPSGCGKSTVLRSMNRMLELVPGARTEGSIDFDGVNILDPDIDAVDLRRRVGMVFQRPNVFPKSIFDNVAFGPRLYGIRGKDLDEIVVSCLQRAAIWDEVKDDYRRKSALALSGGQQQRLCIARTLATEPEVILMDEPCSALDPIATLKIEGLMADLRERYTIVIVTHNMQQAGRVSDETAFFTMGDDRAGYLVEVGETSDVFTSPKHQLTEDYVSGRFG